MICGIVVWLIETKKYENTKKLNIFKTIIYTTEMKYYGFNEHVYVLFD